MEDPTNGVVDKLGLGVGLVATFVGNDPKTGGDEASPEGIQGPERELGGTVENWVWELDNLRVDKAVEESRSFVDSSQGSEVRDTEVIYASNFRCQRTKGKETDT